MTNRIKAEAAGPHLAGRRAGYPRKVFAYPYWVAGWVHPFESRWAAFQKYAWINNASDHEYSILTGDFFGNYEGQTKLEDRLFAAVQPEQRAPRIHLWDAITLPHAVCPVCLESGYWSEMPQLAGYDQCPLHGVVLQRRCRKCLRKLRFGRPRFGHTGPFVCGSCKESLTAYPNNACLQWHKPPSEVLLSRFAPLHSLAQCVATECEGHWGFPQREQGHDAKLILDTYTGHRLHHEWEANDQLFYTEMVEQVSSETFILPCEETALISELTDHRRSLLADVTRYVRQYSSAASPTTRGVVGMKMHLVSHELEIRAGGALLDNVRTILESIDGVGRRKNNRTMEDWLGSELSTYFSASPTVMLVPKILLTFSVWQVVRVLLWLESLVQTMSVYLTDAGGMTDDIDRLLKERPYSIRLRHGRIEEAHFVFELACCSWIPPYRLRASEDEIELTIFQVVPQFDVRGGGWRHDLRKTDAGPIGIA